MKKISILATLCVMACALLLGHGDSAHAQQTYTFTLINKTGYGISKLYAAPHSSKAWDKSDELTRGKGFARGASLKISFKASSAACDLKAAWSDGDEPSEWDNIKLENGATYVMLYDKKTDRAWIQKQ